MLRALVRKVEAVAVLQCRGDITFGEGSYVFYAKVTDVVCDDYQNIVIDLKDVHSVDYSGVGELVSAVTRIHEAGKVVRFAGMNAKIEGHLTHVGVKERFERYPDQEAAIRSFALVTGLSV